MIAMNLTDIPTTAILDGDIIAYKSAFWADQEGIDELPAKIDLEIDRWVPPGIQNVIIAISCPRKSNFRREFWPAYKEHRTAFKTPDSLGYAMELLWETKHVVRCVDHLEADDLLGIMVSGEHALGVSIDKDLRQIPGWHWNPDKEVSPILVDLAAADRFFYSQWISGDSTDNVYGLWRVGPGKASSILDQNPKEDWDRVIWELYLNEDWSKRPDGKRPTITKEEFALAQARCVRILRSGDYNKDTKEIQLWTPNLGYSKGCDHS